MLHHVSVGVTDVERAAKFYDAVLGTLGYKRVMEYLPYAIAYGDSGPSFWIGLPHNQQDAVGRQRRACRLLRAHATGSRRVPSCSAGEWRR